MADKKISQLTAAATPLAGTEVLPIVQSGATVKVSVDNLTKGKTVLGSSFDTDVAAAKVVMSGTSLTAAGTDTNVNLSIAPKGTGGLGINGSPTGDIAGGTVTAKFCVKQDESGPVAGFVKANNSSAAPGSTVYGCRSRGTLASPTIVQNNDTLLSLLALGFDGTDLAVAAQITVEVDGTPGANDMPARVVISTTPDGSQTPVEAMRIDSAQVATFANPVVSPGFQISSGGLITEAGTSRTLSATDNGKVIYCTNGAAVTISCPDGLDVGFSATIVQAGAGKVTLAASGTATLNSYSGLLSTMGQYAVVSVISAVADEFIAAGNLGV
jgi:hypothetical protein